MADAREDFLFQAEMADQAQRKHDMVICMRKAIDIDPNLTDNERYLLNSAYRGVVAPLRASQKVAVHHEEQEASFCDLETLKGFRAKVESELKTYCNEMVTIIIEQLLPTTEETETKVFYQKMLGDYYRYLAECVATEQHQQIVENCMEAYKVGCELASGALPATDPVYLGLRLNVAVFHYEILMDTSTARKIAEDAFDEAISYIDTHNQEMTEGCRSVLEVIRDNLYTWTYDLEESDEDDEYEDVEEEGPPSPPLPDGSPHSC